MAQETLNKIKEAEIQAAAIIKDAGDSGAELVAKAKEAVKQYRESRLSAGRKNAADELKKAQEGLGKALDGADARAEAVTKQFEKNLASKKEAAVQMVIQYITE